MIVRKATVETNGIDLDGQLYLPGESGTHTYPCLCICHGIPSGNPPDPNDSGYPGLAEKICREERIAVFIFNFRGTGESGGNLDMPGWAKDLRSVIDYLLIVPEIDEDRLYLMGFSGGAATSVFVASENPRIAAVIACACPAELRFEDPGSLLAHFREMGAIRDPEFPEDEQQWLDGFLEISPIDRVSEIAPRPLLLIHGNLDDVVDIRQAYDLYRRAGEPKEIIVIDGAGHRLRQNETAMNIAIDWLRKR